MAGCPGEEEVVGLVRGTLAEDHRRAFEQHLDRCSACAAVVADLVRLYPPSPRGDRPEPGSVGPGRTTASAHTSGLAPLVLPFEPGARVGRYHVERCVGAGGMGVVYSAYDPELDRSVALKILREAPATHARQGRLLREAQAIARLAHPNVVTLYHVGRCGPRVFLAMELVEGRTLAGWLRERPRSWTEIRSVFTAAGRGLAAAHRAGLVHRDFKPDNVLLGDDGRVCVTDFGLARSCASDLPEPLDPGGGDGSLAITRSVTRTGARVGTPAYMAPEQHRGLPATPASDQFAFCVALFEALYRVRPFEGSTVSELGRNVAAGQVREVYDPRVPARVRRAVLRGLSLRPEARFRDLDGLVAVLGPRPQPRCGRRPRRAHISGARRSTCG